MMRQKRLLVCYIKKQKKIVSCSLHPTNDLFRMPPQDSNAFARRVHKFADRGWFSHSNNIYHYIDGMKTSLMFNFSAMSFFFIFYIGTEK